MPRLEELANVALRVPSILVLDLLYKCDIEGLTDRLKAKNEDMLFKYKYLIWNMYYIGKFFGEKDLLRHIWSQFPLCQVHISVWTETLSVDLTVFHTPQPVYLS